MSCHSRQYSSVEERNNVGKDHTFYLFIYFYLVVMKMKLFVCFVLTFKTLVKLYTKKRFGVKCRKTVVDVILRCGENCTGYR